MKSLTYEETLNKVETFMVKSGIREFCTEVCQGHCCDGCYNSKNACHRNEGRRLSCSVFLCMNLRDLIFDTVDIEAYTEMDNAITYKLSKIIAIEKGTSANIYYSPHTKEIRDKFFIEDEFLNVLDKIDLTRIKNKLRAIRNIHVISSRFLNRKLAKQME